jgi:hypothetical protein
MGVFRMTFNEISIKFVEHKQQRYNTAGDYRMEDGVLKITISKTDKSLYNLLILVHELIEIVLVIKNGISFRAIDNFDFKFEKDRALGKHNDTDEPGDDRDAPYRKEHQFATWVERALCKFMGLSWDSYCEAVNNLVYKK